LLFRFWSDAVKKILVLGAGQSAPFLINRLLGLAETRDWKVIVGDLDQQLAALRVDGHPKGEAIHFDVTHEDMRNAAIGDADLVINMLSPRFLDLIAAECVHHGKAMFSVSYRTRAIREMAADAERKGILLLTELGLDPGIDHMSAMALIERKRAEGGRIMSFCSYGSGVPAPESIDNPLAYAITWNPRNVVMAAETGAQYMEADKIKCVAWQHVFHHTWLLDIPGVGKMEAYPNRDSLSYMKSFGIEDVHTMIRGTLRHPGWSETWNCMVRLGLPNEHLRIPRLQERTYREVVEMFLPLNVESGFDFERRVARTLNISPTGKIMDNLRWLGLLADEQVECEGDTAAAMLISLLQRKLPLRDDKRDMVVLLHRVEVGYDDRDDEHVTSCMVLKGEPGGFTAMSKTVGLPVVIATRMYLEGELDLVGAHIPLHPSIYEPQLRELAAEGIEFEEMIRPLAEVDSRSGH
jgi:saccharopine dehydrogenase-like NADP-dependent oxidoreductase